jgi:hypothetical protein
VADILSIQKLARRWRRVFSTEYGIENQIPRETRRALSYSHRCSARIQTRTSSHSHKKTGACSTHCAQHINLGQNTYRNLNLPVLAKKVAPRAPAASTAPIPIDWYETIVSSTTRPILVFLVASSDSAVEPLRV